MIFTTTMNITLTCDLTSLLCLRKFASASLAALPRSSQTPVTVP